MAADRLFAFGLFRFDPRSGQLWREGSEMKLTPRVAAVLNVLAERSLELVTKKDLFERVWGGIAVSDDALTSCIQELRGALSDDSRRPRYIETLHRRGYRLMVEASLDHTSSAATQLRVSAPEPSRLVGRFAELQELARGFDLARSGRRQLLCLMGSPVSARVHSPIPFWNDCERRTRSRSRMVNALIITVSVSRISGR